MLYLENQHNSSPSLSFKKIAIVGPESTGKSDLAQALAYHYNTVWVPEVARSYLENLKAPYSQRDVEEIARLQLVEEDKMEMRANNFLFCDTNLLVIKIWMQNAYGNCPEWILNELKTRHYDLILMPDIDLPWAPDPLREHPEKREFFKEWYLEELKTLDSDFHLVSGFGIERLNNAISAIEVHFPWSSKN